jgi:hypothetical protein
MRPNVEADWHAVAERQCDVACPRLSDQLDLAAEPSHSSCLPTNQLIVTLYVLRKRAMPGEARHIHFLVVQLHS